MSSRSSSQGAHNITVRRFTGETEWQPRSMGISATAFQFGSSTTHPAIASEKSKQPEDCFYRVPRKMDNEDIIAWPTFVVEAGVSESLSRLQDTSWWFANSAGMVRIVLLLAVAGHAKTGTFGDFSGVSDCSFASSADSGVAAFDGSVLAGGIPWTWLG